MTDQPKPMSVEEARMALYNASDKSRHDAEDALIAAVERRERTRVLAEFRMLAEKWSMEHDIENGGFYDDGRYEQGKNQQRDYCKDEVNAIIQSLETPNKKP